MPAMSAAAILTGTYDFRVVALSVLIAVLASYTALDLGGRVKAAGRVTEMNKVIAIGDIYSCSTDFQPKRKHQTARKNRCAIGTARVSCILKHDDPVVRLLIGLRLGI